MPHITVKAPFECDEEGIREVERVLRAFAANARAAAYTFRGFGRFGFRTVYMNVDKSPDAVALVRKAVRTVNEHVAWMPKSHLEGNKLHASVARFMTRKQSRRIARYLAHGEKPLFRSAIDNIAILKKEGKTWKVHTVIALPAEEKAAAYVERPHEFAPV